MNRNKVELMGRLTRDVELRNTPSGSAVGTFALAINHTWKDQATGDKREEVTYVECVIWGARAETLGKYTRKGDRLMVDGRLKMESWDDRETGKKRTRMTVVVTEFTFLPNNRPGDTTGRASQPRASQPLINSPRITGQPQEEEGSWVPDEEDDIPF